MSETTQLTREPDHYIRLCPQKTQTNANGTRIPPADYVCRVCNAAGQHFIRDCPTVKERDQERGNKKDLGPAECELLVTKMS